MNSKYSNILTVLLVIVVIVIIGIIGFLGYKYYQSVTTKNNSEDFVDTFQNELKNENNDGNKPADNNDNLFNGVEGGTSSGSSSGNVPKFNGFEIAGTLEIPATKVKVPIIAEKEYSLTALETSVAVIYGVGINQVGNTTIAGHNYRNGQFFSNNKKLNIGDKIYLTDLSGKRMSYTIYNKYETTETDADYITRDTAGATEVSLTTCTDDNKSRLIIWAKAD